MLNLQVDTRQCNYTFDDSSVDLFESPRSLGSPDNLDKTAAGDIGHLLLLTLFLEILVPLNQLN